PPGIFETLICGFEGSSLMLHLLIPRYHRSTAQSVRSPRGKLRELYRFVFSVFLAAAWPLHAAEPGQLDASPSLFTVMAAINAAGYDADLASPSNHPVRMAIRQELAKRNIPSLTAIKEFVAKHKHGNETAELGQYV